VLQALPDLHQQFLDQQVQLVLVDHLPITALSKITMTKQPQPLIRLMQ
jgi:hypothetical protein